LILLEIARKKSFEAHCLKQKMENHFQFLPSRGKLYSFLKSMRLAEIIGLEQSSFCLFSE